MNKRFFLLVLCAASLLPTIQCGQPTYPDIPPAVTPGGYPAAKRAYDSTLGGVQITLIAYNQDSNALTNRPHDEFMEISMLNSPYFYNINGWHLKSASLDTMLALPSSIDHIVYVYTHGIPDSSLAQIFYLGLDSTTWMWRDDHDTARLYDASGKLISELGY